MNYTKMSRKQANVLYRNMKEGNILMKDDLVTFMYERADAHMSYNTLDDATEDYLLGAVDAIFKNDFSKAQECIDSAWISFGSTHGLLETETVTTEVIAAPVEAEATCTCGGSEDHANRIIINTPCGLRYIDVPDYQGETLWDAVAKYDAANGTDLGERLEIDDIVAAGQESTAYSCSPLSSPEDFGEPVTEWKFDDCKVSEEELDHDLHCFVVEMEKDGQIRRQTVYPRDLDDMDALRRHLIGGRSPVRSGWEDGMGNDVCWENAEEVE